MIDDEHFPPPLGSIIDGSLTDGSCVTATAKDNGLLRVQGWYRESERTGGGWTADPETFIDLDGAAASKLAAVIAAWAAPSAAFGKEAEELRKGTELLTSPPASRPAAVRAFDPMDRGVVPCRCWKCKADGAK